MRTVLDLIREYGALNDAKGRRGGSLPSSDEKRLEELKTFYDLLMSQAGLAVSTDGGSFSENDLRSHLTEWNRIRVPAEISVVLRHEGNCYAGRVLNLSRNGVFLTSEVLLDVGSRLNLLMPDEEESSEYALELKAEVTWHTKRGIPEADLPRGMGLQFVELTPDLQEKLDSRVLETIEKQLSGLW
jgi:Tfp pilus assembly protein PilZ